MYVCARTRVCVHVGEKEDDAHGYAGSESAHLASFLFSVALRRSRRPLSWSHPGSLDLQA